MSIFELWLFTTAIPGLGSSVCAIGSVALLSCGAGLFIQIPLYVENRSNEMKKKTWGFIKFFAIISVSCTIIGGLFPSERQMLLIAGGYTATNNAEIKKMPTNAAKAVNAWLDAVTEAADTKIKSTKKN